MSAPPVFLTETRERFLKAIIAELPAEQIRELYLFAPIRQGGVESGVAVIAAALPERVEMTGTGAAPEAGTVDTPDPGAAPTTGTVDTSDSGAAPTPNTAVRYTVYTARYRHTQKGPDRGKWESSVVAEADAPLLSIETVVRGVQRRSGDVDPPDHMSGDEVRSALRLAPPAAGA